MLELVETRICLQPGEYTPVRPIMTGDGTHCFKGWKLSRPQASTRGFALVLELAALDAGLLLDTARKGGGKDRKRRRSS